MQETASADVGNLTIKLKRHSDKSCGAERQYSKVFSKYNHSQLAHELGMRGLL